MFQAAYVKFQDCVSVGNHAGTEIGDMRASLKVLILGLVQKEFALLLAVVDCHDKRSTAGGNFRRWRSLAASLAGRPTSTSLGRMSWFPAFPFRSVFP